MSWLIERMIIIIELLDVKNRNCLLANLEQVKEIPRKLWNRDVAAVLNFRKILMSLRETSEKKRQNQNEGNNSKSPPKLSLWLFNAAQAVEFLGRLLQSKLDQETVTKFKDKLTELLKVRFEDHWDPQQPYRGNGYRAISNFNGQLDPILITASVQANIHHDLIQTHLPRDFVLWIDPFSVSYRVGDHGNIMTLFEDRSRGRITMKMDPSTNNITTNSNTKSPTNSPMMQYLQPRTSTPIRISPPNSPETLLLKGQQTPNIHSSSPLSKKNNEEKPNKGLVMAV
ncbi:uncharacterized protein BX663DRAFT_487064 [Cokeromyces recurvatus]|uniref:uncharacterized protein n=1 Tax=Cokeromyces recurvatus TaxID=90255 RepID=UPI00221FA150|nr:uncharacterized protein BX663DRAFT_487064 [Cokeromyces recurvatus]KAI7901768.1 hypothetical protein BX663DRAFT_487064 [Cokeromyces recurvatus]